MGFLSGFWCLVSERGVNTGKGLSGDLRARFHFLRHAACLFLACTLIPLDAQARWKQNEDATDIKYIIYNIASSSSSHIQELSELRFGLIV